MGASGRRQIFKHTAQRIEKVPEPGAGRRRMPLRILVEVEPVLRLLHGTDKNDLVLLVDNSPLIALGWFNPKHEAFSDGVVGGPQTAPSVFNKIPWKLP